MDEQTGSLKNEQQLSELQARFEESLRNLQKLQQEIEEEKRRIEAKRQ